MAEKWQMHSNHLIWLLGFTVPVSQGFISNTAIHFNDQNKNKNAWLYLDYSTKNKRLIKCHDKISSVFNPNTYYYLWIHCSLRFDLSVAEYLHIQSIMKDPQQRDGLEQTQAKIKSFNKKELKATKVTEHRLLQCSVSKILNQAFIS